DELDEVLCCSITGGDDCADNSVLQDYFGCVFEEFCVVDVGTCTSSGASTTSSRGISDSDSTTADDDSSSRGISDSDSTTTADDGAVNPIGAIGGNDDSDEDDDGDGEDADATNTGESSAPPSVVTMTT
ncbi:unnamed protein product, partial [Pylaiella littoralis]